MQETFLSRLFNKVGEVIESAETPFAKMAVFVLPILAPIVPATFTGLHLYKLLLEVFPQYGTSFMVSLSVVVGIVLELLGYVGAIQFIHSVFRLIRFKDERYWLTVGLTGIAYVFYLAAMFLINMRLGEYFQTPVIINNIIGLLSFITVPTGLLAANYLGSKSEDSLDYQLRQENRQDRMERYRIKHEASKSTSGSPADFRKSNGTSGSTSGSMGRPPVHQERVFGYLEQQYSLTGEVPSFTEVMNSLGLSQSTASRLRREWLDKKQQENK